MIYIFKNKTLTSIISLALIILFHCPLQGSQKEILLYAPISLTEGLNELLSHFIKKNKNYNVKPVYMGTSQLALQIKNGARPDLFISANELWMDYLQSKNLIIKGTRKIFLYNSLVLITNKNNDIPMIKNIKGLKEKLFNSKTKISLAMTKSIPAGIYALDYLKNIKAWSKLNTKYVESINVRAALNFVARGELEYGIVYLSDALAIDKVKIIYNLEQDKYNEIIYPIATLNNKAKTKVFYDFLLSDDSLSVLKKWGFIVTND